MNLHPSAPYWDQGVEAVPVMTGASKLLDCRDVRTIAEAFGISLPFEDVLDVGCGTGRVSRVSRAYLGLDIAPSAIAYCGARHIPAMLITGAQDVVHAAAIWRPISMHQMPHTTPWPQAVALSVMTHISATERVSYLRAIAGVADRLLVDIIPGDGTGTVAAWTAEPAEFEEALTLTGWHIRHAESWRWYDRTHRYYDVTKAVA